MKLWSRNKRCQTDVDGQPASIGVAQLPQPGNDITDRPAQGDVLVDLLLKLGLGLALGSSAAWTGLLLWGIISLLEQWI